MSLPLTSKNLLLTVKEFITVWIDQILYHNKVYDQHIYDKFKAFEHIAYKNRNPNFNEYVDKLITNIFTNILLENGDLRHIVCVIIDDDEDQEVLRKYSINFGDTVKNLQDTINPTILAAEGDNSSKLDIPGLEWKEIYSQFSYLLFHHIQDLKRLQVDDDNTIFFKIFVETDNQLFLTESNWVKNNNSPKRRPPQPRKAVSIGDIDLQLLNFDLINEYYL